MLKKIGYIAIGMMLVSLLFAAAINGVIDIPEVTVSTNPPSGWWRLFFKTDGKLYKRNSAGTETEIGAAAAGGGATMLLHSGNIQDFRGGNGGYAEVTGTSVTIPAMGAGECFVAEYFSTGFGSSAQPAMEIGGNRIVTLSGISSGAGDHKFTYCNDAGVTNLGGLTWVGPGYAVSQPSIGFDFSTSKTFKMLLADNTTYLTLRNFNVRSVK